jgi:hypothetical protein
MERAGTTARMARPSDTATTRGWEAAMSVIPVAIYVSAGRARMRKREHWQVEAVLISLIVAGIVGLWLTRGIADY